MQYVKYIGTAHRRGITRQDWKRIGVEDHDEVWWTAENGWSVPLDKFSDRVIEKVIKPDPGLVIIGSDTEPEAARPGDTPQTWEDRNRVPVITDQDRAEIAGADSGDGAPPQDDENGSSAPSGASSEPSGHTVRGSVGGSTATTG